MLMMQPLVLGVSYKVGVATRKGKNGVNSFKPDPALSNLDRRWRLRWFYL